MIFECSTIAIDCISKRASGFFYDRFVKVCHQQSVWKCVWSTSDLEPGPRKGNLTKDYVIDDTVDSNLIALKI